MSTIAGVDYSSGHPGGAALHAAGKAFAARYVSHDAGKNISRAEADDLAAHSVSTVLVWETTASRAAASRDAGAADAREAAQQAAAAGMPSGRPLYFAVDWDANPSQVVPYFQGVASVLGVARTGVYGGYRVVKYLLDNKLVGWAWQTAAWSGGQWEPRAAIRQYATTVRINGVECDLDTAMTADFGQWTPGKTPLEDDMPTADDIADALMKRLGAPAGVLGTIDDPTVADDPKNPAKDDESLRAMLWTTGANAAHANTNAQAVLNQLKEGVPLTLADAQVAAVADRLASNTTFVTALAHAIGGDLAARLQS